MAYNAITNAEIDTDSPITTSLMTKMRDNPEAIAQGLLGATKVSVENALETSGTTGHILKVGSGGTVVTESETAVGSEYISRRGGASGNTTSALNFTTAVASNGFSYASGEFTYTGSDTPNVVIHFNGNIEFDAVGSNDVVLQIDAGGGYATIATVTAAGSTVGNRIPVGLNAFFFQIGNGDKFRVGYTGTGTNDMQNGQITILAV